MKTTAILFCLALAGCGDDNVMNNPTPDMTVSGFPAVPTLGTQLDRMGRAAINTALTDPFYTDKAAHEGKLDAYNVAPASTWASFADQFTVALGVFDGLDGICGNQPLISDSGSDGGSVAAYGALAGILANDQLLLDTTVASCDPTKNYLAVEVGVITGGAAASCGGRTPLDPAINVTFAVLSGGILSAVDVIDGVTKEADTNAAQLTTFPFLGAAQ